MPSVESKCLTRGPTASSPWPFHWLACTVVSQWTARGCGLVRRPLEAGARAGLAGLPWAGLLDPVRCAPVPRVQAPAGPYAPDRWLSAVAPLAPLAPLHCHHRAHSTRCGHHLHLTLSIRSPLAPLPLPPPSTSHLHLQPSPSRLSPPKIPSHESPASISLLSPALLSSSALFSIPHFTPIPFARPPA